jgi:hypothetical protein
MGFLLGVAEGVSAMQDVHPVYKKGICVPPEATVWNCSPNLLFAVAATCGGTLR